MSTRRSLLQVLVSAPLVKAMPRRTLPETCMKDGKPLFAPCNPAWHAFWEKERRRMGIA